MGCESTAFEAAEGESGVDGSAQHGIGLLTKPCSGYKFLPGVAHAWQNNNNINNNNNNFCREWLTLGKIIIKIIVIIIMISARSGSRHPE